MGMANRQDRRVTLRQMPSDTKSSHGLMPGHLHKVVVNGERVIDV
jgi:hypothetical protein